MNIQELKDLVFAPVEHTIAIRDSILYALGLGYGVDPNDPAQLQFVYEDGLKAVPSMCCVLGYPGFWSRDPKLEIDWVKLLHGEHYFEIHRPIPVEGTVVAHHRIVGVDDKGPGRGAVVSVEKEVYDSSGALLARIEQTNFCRGDGGCGSFGRPAKEHAPLPDAPPEVTHEIATSRQIALLYRLSGDYNPVHADPEIAKKAGYHEPWIHGLCTMGLATRATIEKLCDNDPGRISSMFVRFRNVCFPGETLRFEFYTTGASVRFRAVSVEREIVILDRGEVTLT